MESSDMDIKPFETNVYVHSPLTESSTTANYYVSYAIRLMTDHPSFTYGSSHIRRRYSEFVHLKNHLAAYYPLVKCPTLPPKNFFKRFNTDFIEERRQGLQKFLEQVLSISMYLSDKSLHLFLQSSYSMSEIDGQCIGDIPAPELIEPSSDIVSGTHHSDTSSNRSSEYLEAMQCVRALQNLVIDVAQNSPSDSPTEGKKSIETTDSSSKFLKPPLSSALRKFNSSAKPYPIPRKCGSLESTPSSSPPSSLEASYSSSMDSMRTRRVSFNDKVKIAVVTNYGISVLRT
ncbi:sorting nexin-10B-like [Uloborus diversus]|uniref:sorting nexin-10B-like n=1 Tax=Uloborus diversus TaxID=327109 RepID=UPI00240944DC|nr:sorting nexin-10B-like [Uloborus diversus]